MKRLLKNKNFITILGIVFIAIMLLCMTGCNKQVFDFKYTFDKAYCNYNGDKFELDIDQWKDFDGEQIQIKSDGKTYLISANQCYLVEE